MRHPAFDRIVALSSSPSKLDDTIQFLTTCLRPIIRQSEAALICFPRENPWDFGALLEKAVVQCGGYPIVWENDLRWKTLLRHAFVSKASTIIAPPLIVLGLSKLAAYGEVPLYLFHAVMAGYPCLDWMKEGIEKGLDCKIWEFAGFGTESVVAGFSCDCGMGIHIREDTYKVQLVDHDGRDLPDGEKGRIVLSVKENPKVRYVTELFGQYSVETCPCGNPSKKLVDIYMGEKRSDSLLELSEELLFWTSILDLELVQSEHGLELEIVCFRGEQLPKLPQCARLVLRPWNPEADIPLSLRADWTQP